MITVTEMNLEDSYKIRDIDRSETIEKVYQCVDGKLQEKATSHECPNWTKSSTRR
jgi:hypothetical protein